MMMRSIIESHPFCKSKEKYRESQVSGCNTLQSITWAHKTVNNRQDYIVHTYLLHVSLSLSFLECYNTYILSSVLKWEGKVYNSFRIWIRIDISYNEVGKLKGWTGGVSNNIWILPNKAIFYCTIFPFW